MTTVTEQLQHCRSAFFEAEANGMEAPSLFQVFCDLNPDNVNCRIYDD